MVGQQDFILEMVCSIHPGATKSNLMKKLITVILLLFLCLSVKGQCFPIRSVDNHQCDVCSLPLSLEDTLFIEDLIGEGKHPSPAVLDCFVFKFSEWNFVITYKLKDEERTYIIKEGYIGPIFIYKDKSVTILKED